MSGDNELTIQEWSHSVEATWLGGPFDGATAAINPQGNSGLRPYRFPAAPLRGQNASHGGCE